MDENATEKTQNASKGTRVIKRVIEEEMRQSYVDYAMSVIVGRALPDVRDGLKPVHRRILYAMHEMGLMHNKPFKKSATVVGAVLGKYHPHGDTAVYDSLVRMAQNFSLRYPLIQGQGNFGSIDGDNAAAYRYTESRLQKLAEEVLLDIDKETVDMQPNFDNSIKEPVVMPSKVPNLLINGSSGIAVGMATNIPPHNMGEVVDGIIMQIDNPEIEVNELMKNIRGPDFPTGGIICGTNGIVNAFSTGKGRVVVRARTNMEEIEGKQCIIVSEIPYQVNKSELVTQIADLVRDKKIEGISDLRDESDRDGIRIIIELKRDANSEVVLNQLFLHSRLQTTFGVGMLALVDNEPKLLSLKDMIAYFIEHRKEVVKRRAIFDLNKAKDRAHILEGLIIALNDINPVIKLIKQSNSTEAARNSLMSEYSLSEKQANAILDMKLQKLTSLETEKIREEHKGLLELIKELISILESRQKILDIIKNELTDIKKQYGNERRTEIIDLEITELDLEDIVEEGDMVVTITHSGYIKRMPIDTYKQQRRGGRGIIGATTKEEDSIKDIFIANTHAYLLFFTNKGKVYWLKVYCIPEANRQSKGKAVVNLLELEKDEFVTASIPIKEFSDDKYLLMSTRGGIIKKTNLMAYSNPRKGGIIAISLIENDELINVKITTGNDEIILATEQGCAIRFNERDARETGRSAQGVIGIRLRNGDKVVDVIAAEPQRAMLTITENGYGKRTNIEEYRLIGRGGYGVRNIICSERNGRVVAICSVADSEDIMVITKNGIVIRVPVSDISLIGRNTQGVRIMKLEDTDRVVGAAKVVKEGE